MISPLGLKAQLWAAAGAAMLCMALTSWALLERSGRMQAKATNAYLAAQGQLLAESVNTCTAGVEEVKRVGEAAIAGMGGLIEKAEKLAAPKWRTVERIERVIEKPVPVRADGAAADCNDAWGKLEAEHRKAGAAP